MLARNLACLVITGTAVVLAVVPSTGRGALASDSAPPDAPVTCRPSGGAPALSLQPEGLRATYAHRCDGGDIRTLGLEQMVPEIAIERLAADGSWRVVARRVSRPRSGFRFPADHAAFRYYHQPAEPIATGR
jgi:hypothetical protein